MSRTIGYLALGLVAFGLGHASAQPSIPDGAFVRDSADNTWLVTAGSRAVVPIYPASDDEIRALPENGRWVTPASGGLVALGDRPAWGDDPVRIKDRDDPPKVTVRLSSADITRGGTLEVTVLATDDVGLEWIEWEGEVPDKDQGTEASDLAREHRFECEGRIECANSWTIPATGIGRYVIVGRARDKSGQHSEATADLTVR